MPEPNRPPWQVGADLDGLPIWALVADAVTVRLECESCHHAAEWRPGDLDRLFRRVPTKTLSQIGPKLRCRACRSEWVRVSRAPPAETG
jgi:hypothetical protein